ncbi:MAG: hypothetical protein JXR86_14930 [Spirochaetales bacterium]|nr:hypothetical protein [Spirochaetales bacterium]
MKELTIQELVFVNGGDNWTDAHEAAGYRVGKFCRKAVDTFKLVKLGVKASIPIIRAAI